MAFAFAEFADGDDSLVRRTRCGRGGGDAGDVDAVGDDFGVGVLRADSVRDGDDLVATAGGEGGESFQPAGMTSEVVEAVFGGNEDRCAG